MKNDIMNRLIPKGRTIFFDEEAHKYSNELGFVYTSTTTIIGKYCEEKNFEDIAKACERIGRNPNHPKYQFYKGKSARQLLVEWGKITDESCEFGSAKHNFLESSVKQCTKYNINAKGFINGIIYTIDNIIENHKFGKLSLKQFEKVGIKEKYPDIYNILVTLSNNGYSLYAEIGVYCDIYGISGLIDILAVNHSTEEFIIVDWKTNKAPIRFDAGYYEKDLNGLLDLNKWKPSKDTFIHPLKHLADSVGNHYTMQLSVYAYLVTTFGYKYKGLVLCHIRPIEEPFVSRELWKEKVEIYKLDFMLDNVKLMLADYKYNRESSQGKLLFN